MPFGFNPVKVPSFMVKGHREPCCATCLDKANITRKAHGLPPFPPPLPGAYDVIDENELPTE